MKLRIFEDTTGQRVWQDIGFLLKVGGYFNDQLIVSVEESPDRILVILKTLPEMPRIRRAETKPHPLSREEIRRRVEGK